MDLQTLKNKFYDLIEVNRTREVFQLLVTYIDDYERIQFTHIRAEFNTFESESLRQDAKTVRNSRSIIRDNLIRFFRQLEERLLQEQIEANKQAKEIKRDFNATKRAMQIHVAEVKILWLFKQTENCHAFSTSEIQKKCNFSDRGIIYNAIQCLNECQFLERVEGEVLAYRLSPRGKKLVHGMDCELSFELGNSGIGLLDTNV